MKPVARRLILKVYPNTGVVVYGEGTCGGAGGFGRVSPISLYAKMLYAKMFSWWRKCGKSCSLSLTAEKKNWRSEIGHAPWRTDLGLSRTHPIFRITSAGVLPG